MTLSSAALAAGIVAVLALVLYAIWRLYRRRPPAGGVRAYVLGLNALIDGDEEAAYRHLHGAAQSGLQSTDLYLRLGDLLRGRGRLPQALQTHLGLTVKADLTPEERVRVMRSLAEDYSLLGRTDDCIATLEALLGLEGQTPDLLRRLAHEYYRAGEIQKAFKTLRSLSRKTGAPGDRELATFLASAAEDRVGDPGDTGEEATQEARRLLGKALKLDPRCPPALRLKGRLAFESGDLDAVVDAWVPLAVAEPALGPELYEKMEKLLFEKGRFDELGAIYRNVLSENPEDEEAALGLAAFQEKKGVPGSAVEVLESHLSGNGASNRFRAALALLHLKNDNRQGAEEILRQQVETRRSAPTYRCGACGSGSTTMRWYCPECNRFDSYRTEIETS